MVTLTQIKGNHKQKTPENYWMMVLLYFASFLVGLGIVAEVAANWQQIPNAAKLSGAVLLMVLNAVALTWCDKKDKNLLKQVVAVVFAFLIMGTIGLIGQVFQLNSNFANACLMWAVISWPLLFFVPRLLWFWLPVFYIGMRFYIVIYGDIISLFVGNSMDSEVRQLFFARENPILQICGFVAFYGVFMVYEYLMNSKYKDNYSIINPLRFYLGLIVMGIYYATVEFVNFLPNIAGHLQEYIYFFGPYFALAILLYLYNGLKDRFSFMPLFLAGLAPEASLILTRGGGMWYIQNTEVVLPIVFLLIFTAYAYYNKMQRLQKLSILALLLWFVITFQANIFNLIPSLMFCAIFAFWAYKRHSRKGFNTFVIVAVLRILVYYADVDNLEHFGIYLIGSGLLIIATILGLFKYGKFLWREADEK